jgi:hypothetical protein
MAYVGVDGRTRTNKERIGINRSSPQSHGALLLLPLRNYSSCFDLL